MSGSDEPLGGARQPASDEKESEGEEDLSNWDPVRESYKMFPFRTYGHVQPADAENAPIYNLDGEAECVSVLRVQNVPKEMTREGLVHQFSPCGGLVNVIRRNSQYREYDWAIVEFASLKNAEKAMKDLQDKPPFHFRISFYKVTVKTVEEGAGSEHDQEETESGDEFELFKPKATVDSCDQPRESHELIDLDRVKRSEMLRKIIEFLEKIKVNVSVPSAQKQELALATDPNESDHKESKSMTQDIRVDPPRGGLELGRRIRVLDVPQCLCQTCKMRPASFVCLGCEGRFYCSQQCQYKDWSEHSQQCAQMTSRQRKLGVEKHPPLTVGRKVLATPAWIVSPSEIYLLLIDEGVSLLEMNEELDRLKKATIDAEKGKSYDPYLGELVGVVYYQDGQVYRAVVDSLEGDTAVVNFVDFGNRDVVHRDTLFPLDDEASKYPAFAVCLSLDGAKEGDSVPSEKLPLKLAESYTLHVKESERGSVIGDLQSGDSSAIEELGLASQVFWREIPCTPWEAMMKKVMAGERVRLESFPIPALRVGSALYAIPMDVTSPDWIMVAVADALALSQLARLQDQLNAAMDDFYEVGPDYFYRPRAGDICIARSRKLREWVRAAILEVNEQDVSLIHLDFGIVEPVSTSLVAPIRKEFLDLPGQCIACCFAASEGRARPQNGWSQKASRICETVLRLYFPVPIEVAGYDEATKLYHVKIPSLEKAFVEAGIFS